MKKTKRPRRNDRSIEYVVTKCEFYDCLLAMTAMLSVLHQLPNSKKYRPMAKNIRKTRDSLLQRSGWV